MNAGDPTVPHSSVPSAYNYVSSHPTTFSSSLPNPPSTLQQQPLFTPPRTPWYRIRCHVCGCYSARHANGRVQGARDTLCLGSGGRTGPRAHRRVRAHKPRHVHRDRSRSAMSPHHHHALPRRRPPSTTHAATATVPRTSTGGATSWKKGSRPKGDDPRGRTTLVTAHTACPRCDAQS